MWWARAYFYKATEDLACSPRAISRCIRKFEVTLFGVGVLSRFLLADKLQEAW